MSLSPKRIIYSENQAVSDQHSKKRWCIPIKLKILVFYKNEEALESYLRCFNLFDATKPIRKTCNNRLYETDAVLCQCIKGLKENSRGHKAHIIAVEEELTWDSRWKAINDDMLRFMIISPIDIQVFDSISMSDVFRREGAL